MIVVTNIKMCYYNYIHKIFFAIHIHVGDYMKTRPFSTDSSHSAEISMVDFVAVDFETANSLPSSACAIGIATVRNLKVTDTFYSLLKPPGLRFSEQNIAIHGIRPQDVAFSPTLTEIWPEISAFFENAPVLAHNAHFDMTVLRNSLDAAQSHAEDFTFADTVTIARRFVTGRLTLDACARSLGVPLTHHHNALADAVACAQIAARCMELAGETDLMTFCRTQNVNTFQFRSLKERTNNGLSRRTFSQAVRISDLKPCAGPVDQAHPLCGKNLVFTGELSIGRQEAMQLAVDVGAVIRSTVSSKTDYLVIGKQDFSLVGDTGMSEKEKKAAALISRGKAHINRIGEEAFLRLIAAKNSIL